MTDIPYTRLCALAELHGTDKRPEPLGHGYTHYYHSLFAGCEDSIKKVVELGIDTGASLRMWESYFPAAIIHGIDCDPLKLFTEDRIQCYLCDQSDPSALMDVSFRIGWDIDFMIDDGSHRPDDQALTAEIFVPLLSPTGIYIIEDVLEPKLVTALLPFEAHIEYFKIDRDPWSKLMVIRAS